MRYRLGVCVVSIMCVLPIGCGPEETGQVVGALAAIPFVDRTEKEINNWFNNTTIVDDKKIVSAAVNGEPTILLLTGSTDREINGIIHPAVLCVTQYNTIEGQNLKYAARVAIEVLNHQGLFGCGPIELASCDGNPMAANVISVPGFRNLDRCDSFPDKGMFCGSKGKGRGRRRFVPRVQPGGEWRADLL